jgi:hypothetical protein
MIDTSLKVDTVTNDYIVINNTLAKLNLKKVSSSNEENLSNEKRVQRKGDTLLFKLQNGKIFILLNKQAKPELELEDRSYIEYKYLGIFNSKYWTVKSWAGYNGTENFILINSSNGEKVNLKSYPICSSLDNKYFITNFVEECWGHYVELYKLVNSNYQLIQKIFFENNIWMDKVGWINNNIIVIKIQEINKTKNVNQYILLKLN